MKAIALCIVLLCASCGVLRLFTSTDGEAPATKILKAAGENGSDPVKWATWLAFGGGGLGAGAVTAKVVGDRRRRQRRQLSDRRVAGEA